MKILVGYTGFVGFNLLNSFSFDKIFNSQNIKDAFGLNPELCVYAGVRGHKFLANKYPLDDLKHIEDTMKNLSMINPKKLILISSVDVLDKTIDVNENYVIDENILNAYGKNRYFLEKWALKNFNDLHILRLPALYGLNIKKNFIYDLINPIPNILTEHVIKKFNIEIDTIKKYYKKKDKDLFYLNEMSEEEKLNLISYFQKINFSSKYLTDSRASFQYYPLFRLWSDIQIVIENKISLIHLVTEPIKNSELHTHLFKTSFNNETFDDFQKYDVKTIYGLFFNDQKEYLINKKENINNLSNFMIDYQRN
jgi:hypothetical protein